MNPSPYFLALISGGFALAGVLLGGLMTNHFAVKRDERNRIISNRRAAAVAFISVIAKELVAVSSEPVPSSRDNIHVAIIKFKPHLGDEQKKQIEETWEKYNTLEHNRATQAQSWGHAMGGSMTRELLEKLLKFTENYDKNS
jgi:hypothetical protein